MNSNGNKTISPVTALVNQFGAQKKKGFIATGLVLMMAFMWIRVLTGDDPKSANAALKAQPKSETQTAKQQLKVTFVELPSIAGRHDVLNRDFFRMDGGVFGSAKQASIVSSQGGQEGVRQVADRLRLEAISMGREPEAFINDRILKVGDKLNVKDGSKSYVCEIGAIKENVVIVRYEESEIELKLKQPNEAND